MVTATAGESVHWSFQGSAIYWRAVADHDGGRADVSIDGVVQTTVDCFFAECALPYQFAFMKSGLDSRSTRTRSKSWSVGTSIPRRRGR